VTTHRGYDLDYGVPSLTGHIGITAFEFDTNNGLQEVGYYDPASDIPVVFNPQYGAHIGREFGTDLHCMGNYIYVSTGEGKWQATQGYGICVLSFDGTDFTLEDSGPGIMDDEFFGHIWGDGTYIYTTGVGYGGARAGLNVLQYASGTLSLLDSTTRLLPDGAAGLTLTPFGLYGDGTYIYAVDGGLEVPNSWAGGYIHAFSYDPSSQQIAYETGAQLYANGNPTGGVWAGTMPASVEPTQCFTPSTGSAFDSDADTLLLSYKRSFPMSPAAWKAQSCILPSLPCHQQPHQN